MTIFYKNFLDLCAKHNKTPSGVAAAIGLSNAAASGWKNGKTPSDLTVNKIANYFGVSVSELTEESKQAQAAKALESLLVDFGALSTELAEIQDLQTQLLNATIDQLKEALTGLDTNKKFDLAMFLLNDVKGNEEK